MARLLIEGHAIDMILALIGVEAVALVALRALTGRGPASVGLVANLLAGAFLILGLRGALAGAPAAWVAAALAASLVAHGADLAARWGERKESTPGGATASRLRADISLSVRKPHLRSAPPSQKPETPHA